MNSRCRLLSKFPDTPSKTVVFLGRRGALTRENTLALLPAGSEGAVRAMLSRTEPGDFGRISTIWREQEPSCLIIGLLPESCSRHNSESRAWAIHHLLKSVAGDVTIVVSLSSSEHGFASALAVARSVSEVQLASTRRQQRQVDVVLQCPSGVVVPPHAQLVMDAVRFAGSWVDLPPNYLTTTRFVQIAQQIAKDTGSSIHIRTGEQLQSDGLGGLYAVGKASTHPPSLVVLDHKGDGDTEKQQVWVGKGIVYDTGGLSIKSKTGMPGMKADMGGAAAVLAAFSAAVQANASTPITAILCLAENSVNERATRPDDVIAMYSGRTVEVNNTDAEGRLVLADGVVWGARHRDPALIIDIATLTGAQLVSTGKLHGALVSNSESFENQTIVLGRRVGELVHPLPFSPELFRKEFVSSVADMKNSPKDRSNAQASCAGQFIYNHLSAVDPDVPWIHLDVCGPATTNGRRGTGFGVALLWGLAGLPC